MLNRVSIGLAYRLARFCGGKPAAVLLATILGLSSITLAAERGRVVGSVADPAGGKVAGARVALRDATGAVVYQGGTGGDGQFSISDVVDGHYTISVVAPGFTQPHEATVDVRAGATETIAVRLEVAAISDRIVVTATRTETAASEFGGSTSLVASEDLKLGNQSLITESLRVIPGLSVVQTGGRGGLTSIFARGGESDYNKVLIDGVPVNAAGGLFDFASLTPENIDRVEVVRGPGSALFGSDAMTSVIQLVTHRGSTATPEFEFSGEGGSFDYHRETALVSGLSRWFDYSTSFGFQTTDGRFRNNDFINRSASANLGFRLTSSAELRVTSRWNNNTLGVPGATALLFADPDQRQKHRDLALAAVLDLKTNSRWHQTARFVYSEFETHSFDPVAEDLSRPDTPALAPGAFGNDFAFTFRDHEKRSGFQYQTIVAVTASNIITGGVDYEHESAAFTDDFSRVSPARNNLGVYLQDQAALRARLFVTAGVRIERNTGSVPADLKATLASLGSSAPTGDVGFGLSANPKIAATFVARTHRDGDPIGATRLKASFGTGIKEPRLDEAFSPSPFFLGNPKLDPERAVGFDAGAAQEFFGRRASVELSYFENRFRDLIVFESDPLTFGPIKLPDGRLTNFVNFDRASARGLELVGAARPLLRLRVAASYTFLRSRLQRAADASDREVGLPLLRRPAHLGSIQLNWTAPRYDLSLDGSFIGRRRDIDPVSFSRFDKTGRAIFNGGYAKLNAAGSYHMNHFVSLFARVENMLNQDYQEVLGFPAHSLNFTVGLRVRVGGNK